MINRPPFTDYRVSSAPASNAVKLAPLPCKRFSASQVEQLTAWLQETYSAEVSVKGTCLLAVLPDDVRWHQVVCGTTLARTDKAAAKKANRMANMNATQQTEAEEYNSLPSSAFVNKYFPAVDAYSRLLVARFLDGQPYSRVMGSGQWLDGLAALTIPAEGTMDSILTAIKAKYETGY